MAPFCVSSRLVLPFLVLLLGCQAKVEPASHEVRQQLEDFKSQINTLRASNLDAALRHSNLAIQLVQENQLGTDELLHLQLHRSELFDLMGLPDSAELVIAMTDSLLQSQEDPYQKALMSFCKGVHLFAFDQYQEAEIHLQEAGAYFLQNPQDPQAGKVFQELANFYTRTGQLPRAHDFLLKAATSFSQMQDSSGVLAANIRLATVFSAQDLQQELTDKLEEILSSQQSTGMAALNYTDLHYLALSAQETRPDSAFAWQQIAAQKALQAGDSINYYLSLVHLNAFRPDLNNLEKAAAYFNKIGNTSNFVLASNTLGHQLLKINDLDRAKIWLDQAQKYATGLENPYELIPVLSNLQQWSLKAGQKDMFRKIQDELYNINKSLDKKNTATTLEFLVKAQKLEQINHQKKLFAAKLEQQKEKLRFRNGFILMLTLAMLVLGIAARKVYQVAQRKKMAMQVLLDAYKTELQHITANSKNDAAARKPETIELKNMVLDLVEKQNTYLKSGIKVEDFTTALNISYKEFNQFLKEVYGTNFNNFINSYRVEHAKKILLDPGFQHFTIEGIAMESGFGSKQSFYQAFQQFTGVTPGEYKEILLRKTQEK